jgi:hypothetical protein
MGLVYDLEVRKDVKGGSPKTPVGARVAEFNDYSETVHGSHGVSAVWRTVAVSGITALIALSGAVFTIGLDNVKHSEIDTIMAARAPYLHDKQRIEDHFRTLEVEQDAQNKRMDKLESIARDDFDKRIRDLESKK